MYDPKTPVQVAVPKPLHTTFSYLVPGGTERPRPGARVRVPFGRQTLVGLCIDGVPTTDGAPVTPPPTGQDPPAPGAAPVLREIIEVIDSAPLLPADVLALGTWAARYYHHPIGDALFTALPALLRKGAATATFDEERLRAGAASREGRRAPRQTAAMEWVLAAGGSTTREALLQAGFPARIVNTLLQRGALERVAADPAPSIEPVHPPNLALTAEQRVACDALAAGPPGTTLLQGVTGSGKTEVYLRTIDAILRAGRQVLVLIPEIALTPQTVARFEERFGAVHVYHSAQTDLSRARVWQACRTGRARIVVGTRSAVWLPFVALGLIVVDEEHDGSFKQQEGLRYSARDLAVKRGRSLDVPVVLGSATPSLESLHNAHRGRYGHLRLTHRTAGAAMPTLSLVDLRGQTLAGGMSLTVQRAARRHLDAGGQVLLFINRRGFAPTLLCGSCGWTAVCPRCDSRLTLHHRPAAQLRCHHCGYTSAVPNSCPSCELSSLVSIGLGTQRSEQGVETLFPDTPVIRIDRDNVRSARRLEDQLDIIRTGRPAVLVGTQLLAKGHHFPAVTLVVVLNADAGFMSPDFRAPEHTAQLIVQVAGRAGREDRAGQVLIQTFNPDNTILLALIESGYEGFAATELAQRAAARMPPFRPLALMRAEGASFETVMATLETLVAESRGVAGLEVLGPAPAPIGKRANRFRCQCLITAGKRSTLHEALDRIVSLHGNRRFTGVRWSVDVDPHDTF